MENVLNIIKIICFYMNQKNSQISKIVGNYALMEKIGEGSFSKVYSGFDFQSLKKVAVKVIRFETIKQNKSLINFVKQQKKALNLLKGCPHIIQCLDFFETSNNCYFVYELCDQGSLQQRIQKQGYFKQQKAIGYLKQILYGFKSIISKRIIHRDIKPHNILFKNGKLKIADFGLCKILQENINIAMSMVGTLNYQSPEITYGNYYSNKCDIYSTGVLFYRMLYGVYPFQGKCFVQMINQLQNEKLEFPSSIVVSDQTKNILRKMLQKKQLDRIDWQEIFSYFQIEQEVQRLNKNNSFLKVPQQSNNKPNNIDFIKNKSRAQTQATETTGNIMQNESTFSFNSSIDKLKDQIEQLLQKHQYILDLTQLTILINKKFLKIQRRKILKRLIKHIEVKLKQLISKLKAHQSEGFQVIRQSLTENLKFLEELLQKTKLGILEKQNSYSQKYELKKEINGILQNIKRQRTKGRQHLELGVRLIYFFNCQSLSSSVSYKDLSQQDLLDIIYSFKN